MTFAEQLNELMKKSGCTGKELSEASGLSAAVISRYRNGTRKPTCGGEHIEKLAKGLCTAAKQNGTENADYSAVLGMLSRSIQPEEDNSRKIRDNLNTLISLLNINISEMARNINYDASYISRIRSSLRKPADPEEFFGRIADYVARKYVSQRYLDTLSELISNGEPISSDEKCRRNAIFDWLTSCGNTNNKYIEQFLTRLDVFSLNEYIRSIHFDELKVPSVPFVIKPAKEYYGIDGMKKRRA